MKKVGFAVLACVFMAGPAMADMTYYTTDGVTMGFGDAVEGNSWSYQVHAGGITLDLIAAKIASAGDVFEKPAGRDISVAGWSAVLDTPKLASWSGPTTSNITGHIYLENDLDKDVTIDFALFYGDKLVWTSREIIVDGSPFGYEGPSQHWLPTRAEVVPVPGAVLLGMLGLSLVGVKLRKHA